MVFKTGWNCTPISSVCNSSETDSLLACTVRHFSQRWNDEGPGEGDTVRVTLYLTSLPRMASAPLRNSSFRDRYSFTPRPFAPIRSDLAISRPQRFAIPQQSQLLPVSYFLLARQVSPSDSRWISGRWYYASPFFYENLYGDIGNCGDV